jgi:hypothetical protein
MGIAVLRHKEVQAMAGPLKAKVIMAKAPCPWCGSTGTLGAAESLTVSGGGY